jgi:hypothetical protein
MAVFDQVASLVEEWVAVRKPRHLSRRKLPFLEEFHTRAVSEPMFVPDVADGFFCEELALTAGSTWSEVVAELLDYVAPRNGAPTRLMELQEAG